MERTRRKMIDLYRGYGKKTIGACLIDHNSQRKQTVTMESVHRDVGLFKHENSDVLVNCTPAQKKFP